MDANTRNFISGLLADNERLEQLAGLGFGIASLMQQLADNTGCGFGVPTLAPNLPLPVLQQIARDLAGRVNPPESAPNGDSVRVPVGAGRDGSNAS